MKTKNSKVFIICTRGQCVFRGFALVDEVGIEHIELVSLDDLGGWIVSVVVRLVVLVPFKTSMDSVDEPRLSRPILPFQIGSCNPRDTSALKLYSSSAIPSVPTVRTISILS